MSSFTDAILLLICLEETLDKASTELKADGDPHPRQTNAARCLPCPQAPAMLMCSSCVACLGSATRAGGECKHRHARETHAPLGILSWALQPVWSWRTLCSRRTGMNCIVGAACSGLSRTAHIAMQGRAAAAAAGQLCSALQRDAGWPQRASASQRAGRGSAHPPHLPGHLRQRPAGAQPLQVRSLFP